MVLVYELRGTIVQDLFIKKCNYSNNSFKSYDIPAFVSNETLVIACSYSGNTEETIMALDKCIKKDAEIAIVTSGGKLQKQLKTISLITL